MERVHFDTETAKGYFRHVCMLLLKDNLDLNKIMKYLERTVKHASNARKVLMELIEEYPSNTQV